MEEIIHESAEPLSHQIFKILRTKILNKDWESGALMPSEAELIEQYQVSRTTIREALSKLVNEGLIYRQRGRGTFVASAKIEEGLDHVIRFHEGMRQHGFKSNTRILRVELVPLSKESADLFNLSTDDKVVAIRRLRLVDNEPMSIETSIIPHRYCPGLLQYDFSKISLYEVLEHEYGLSLIRGTQLVQAVLATNELAEELNVSLNFPLLYVERISYSPQNILIEELKIHYRGDHYALRTEFVE